MKRVAEISLTLRCFDGDITAFSESLEVSLDCYVCGRRCRTVGFRELEAPGICTPTHHPFP